MAGKNKSAVAKPGAGSRAGNAVSPAEKVARVRVRETKDWGKIVLIGSVVAAVVLLMVGIVGQLNPGLLPIGVIDGIIFAVLAITGPYGFYHQYQVNKIKKIEKYLPDFLRDVAEAGRFGMTLAEAIIVASSGRYGKLTPEIKKMAAQIEWGVPASEALRLFAERVNTPLVNRVVSIIVKAYDAGGNVADVLTLVSHSVKEEQLTESEKRIEMGTYVIVIYIAFFVFLVTILIMNQQFLPKMAEAGSAVAAGAGGASAPRLINVEAINQIKFLFFISAIVHAIGDGFVAGVLQDGKILSGMRHSFILTLAGYIALMVVGGGL